MDQPKKIVFAFMSTLLIFFLQLSQVSAEEMAPGLSDAQKQKISKANAKSIIANERAELTELKENHMLKLEQIRHHIGEVSFWKYWVTSDLPDVGFAGNYILSGLACSGFVYSLVTKTWKKIVTGVTGISCGVIAGFQTAVRYGVLTSENLYDLEGKSPETVESFYRKSLCIYSKAKLAIEGLDRISSNDFDYRDPKKLFTLSEDQTAVGIEKECYQELAKPE